MRSHPVPPERQVPARRGRRPLPVFARKSAPVCVKLSPEAYDQAYAEAERQGTTVPSVLRSAFERVFGYPK